DEAPALAAPQAAACGHAAAEARRKAEGQETEAAARQSRQRALDRRTEGRARGGADARRLLAQSRRGAELEIAAGRPARTLQALPVASAVARRARRGATCLQRRSQRRRAQRTHR